MASENLTMFGEVPEEYVEEYEAPPTPITPRDYQSEALEKIIWAKSSGLEGNDIVVLPTGAGKSIVIALLANALHEPVLILQPSKEILEQNYAKLCLYVKPADIGIYSASMDEKTIGHYTFATIQSIYKQPELFAHFGLFIIDECHQVNPKSFDGMFASFIKKVNEIRFKEGKSAVKIVGFTATPYRMDTSYTALGGGAYEAYTSTKLINRMKGFFWKRMLYVSNMAELMEKGYLCPLEYIDRSVVQHEELKLNVSQSDFDLDAYEDVLSRRQREIMDAIAYGMKTAKSTLVFCSSVSQATKLSQIVPGAAVVSAKTPKKERDAIIKGFKAHEIPIVFNVGVLTTGFDHPALDCIVLLRPTRSIGLYYQMLGRGVRIAEGKTSCKVIDLTSTVKNMGRIETIKLVKRDKWELESESCPNWHGAQLYSYTFTR